MSEVVVVADIRVAPGRADALVQAFEQVIARTHIERYRSQADVDSHMGQPWTKGIFAWAAEPGNSLRRRS